MSFLLGSAPRAGGYSFEYNLYDECYDFDLVPGLWEVGQLHGGQSEAVVSLPSTTKRQRTTDVTEDSGLTGPISQSQSGGKWHMDGHPDALRMVWLRQKDIYPILGLLFETMKPPRPRFLNIQPLHASVSQVDVSLWMWLSMRQSVNQCADATARAMDNEHPRYTVRRHRCAAQVAQHQCHSAPNIILRSICGRRSAQSALSFT